MIKTTLGLEAKITLCESDGAPATSENAIPLVEHMAKNTKLFGTEYLGNTIEVRSQPHDSVDGVMSDIKRGYGMLLEEARRRRLKLLALGIHPMMQWRKEQIFPSNHNTFIAHITPFGGKRYVGNGLHVHVGSPAFMEDRELLISVLNQARFYLPHLLALSASSPFWNGYDDSGFSSYRAANLLPGEEAFGGMPTLFRDAAEHQAMVALMDEVLPGLKVNADLRINRTHQTLEFLVMDMVPDMALMSKLAALCQTLVVHLAERYKSGNELNSPMWLNRLNRWIAAKYGSIHDIKFIAYDQVPTPWPDVMKATLEDVRESSQALGYEELLADLPTLRCPARDMVNIYNETLFDSTPELAVALSEVTSRMIARTEAIA